MNDIQYILLQNAIKQNHFRKTNFEKTFVNTLITIGVVMIITAIISQAKTPLTNNQPLLEFKMRLLLSFTGFLISLLGVMFLFIINFLTRGDKEDQLDELKEAKEWCEEFPHKADKLDFSAFENKAIHNEFFQKE